MSKLVRYVIVKTPDYKNKSYIKTKKFYQINKKEFHDRYTKLKSIKNMKKFEIELIGFDGTIKKTYKKVNSFSKNVLKDIDAMPMGNIRRGDLINLSLYSDYHPKTSTKKTGYKDKETALRTLNIIKDRKLTYQKQVVTTMYNRAKYHPNQTKGMRDAMKVFKKWLKMNSKRK